MTPAFILALNAESGYPSFKMATYFDCDDNCGLSFYLRDLSSVPRGSQQELWFFLCAIGQVLTQSVTNTDVILEALEGLTPATGTFTLTRLTLSGDESSSVPAGWVAAAFYTPTTNVGSFSVAGAAFLPGAAEGYGGPDGYTGTEVTIIASGEVADTLSFGFLTLNP